jgi:hypothetical protein
MFTKLFFGYPAYNQLGPYTETIDLRFDAWKRGDQREEIRAAVEINGKCNTKHKDWMELFLMAEITAE